MKFSLQYPTDQRVDQKYDHGLTESHPPGQYLDVACCPGLRAISRCFLPRLLQQQSTPDFFYLFLLSAQHVH